MISGILLTAALLSANPPSAAPDLAPFVARLARPAPARTAYTEVRFARLLRQPLVLHGELEYGGAGRLGKRVDAPYRETTTIADGDVEVQRDGRTARHFELARAPELGALLTSFSAVLGGDAATLEKFYAAELVENAAMWTLTLTPRDAALGKRLRRIAIDGTGNEPRCFVLDEANGDASVLLVGPLAAAKLPDPLTPNALDAVCRAP